MLNQHVRDSKGLQVCDEDCHRLCLFTVEEARTWSAQQKCGLAEAIRRGGGLKSLIESLHLTWVNPTSRGMQPTRRLVQPSLSKEKDDVQQSADMLTEVTLDQQKKLGMDDPNWQLFCMPRTDALTKLGPKGAQLANKVKQYGRNELAGLLNWDLADSYRFPNGYFSVSFHHLLVCLCMQLL